jgi:hypothetical protein
MPFCLLLSGKALKDRTHAVGDLKQTIYPHHNAPKACYTQMTLLCEVIMVTHNDATCIYYAFPSPPQRHQALKEHTNVVGDL